VGVPQQPHLVHQVHVLCLQHAIGSQLGRFADTQHNSLYSAQQAVHVTLWVLLLQGHQLLYPGSPGSRQNPAATERQQCSRQVQHSTTPTPTSRLRHSSSAAKPSQRCCSFHAETKQSRQSRSQLAAAVAVHGSNSRNSDRRRPSTAATAHTGAANKPTPAHAGGFEPRRAAQ
jgi:hypothetical protein